MTRILELNEQQEDLITYFLEKVLNPIENYGETTKAVALQIMKQLKIE